MIHINLLPVREIVRIQKAKRQILLGVSLFLVLLLFLSIVEMFQLNHINYLKSEEVRINNEKKQYLATIAEIKRIEEEKKLMLTRIEVINKLKQSSSQTVHVMDEVANLTPANRMWLKSLSQNDTQLTLSGMALDDQTVAKYMDDLEASEYLQNVILVSSKMEVYADRNLKAFSVSAQVVLPKK